MEIHLVSDRFLVKKFYTCKIQINRRRKCDSSSKEFSVAVYEMCVIHAWKEKKRGSASDIQLLFWTNIYLKRNPSHHLRCILFIVIKNYAKIFSNRDDRVVITSVSLTMASNANLLCGKLVRLKLAHVKCSWSVWTAPKGEWLSSD